MEKQRCRKYDTEFKKPAVHLSMKEGRKVVVVAVSATVSFLREENLPYIVDI